MATQGVIAAGRYRGGPLDDLAPRTGTGTHRAHERRRDGLAETFFALRRRAGAGGGQGRGAPRRCERQMTQATMTRPGHHRVVRRDRHELRFLARRWLSRMTAGALRERNVAIARPFGRVLHRRR